VISSEVLRKHKIDIPREECHQVRLLGVQGQATIQDKVVVVFELFGNRVGLDGKERVSFNAKYSFLLQVKAIIVDDPNVTMLLGMQEAVNAELVFHAQSGRIMRMIQPYGANVHVYQATTIFTTGFMNGSTNTTPPEEEEVWESALTEGNDYERRSATDLLAFNQVYLHGVCNGEPLYRT
jgi:outer membrane lipoprotein-sorting protein